MRDSPSAHRNRAPIEAVLRDVLPARGRVLEVASGSGQHAAWYAAAFPDLLWQPTDGDPAALASISAWREQAAVPNLAEPAHLDVTQPIWPFAEAAAIVAINMIHASSWDSTLGLLAGATRILSDGGPLVLYGAWREQGETAPSNVVFDADLKSRNPSWGIRDVERVIEVAASEGLHWERTVAMPANNRTLVLRKGLAP